MASDDVAEQFPDVSSKLNAAKKLSAFEKDKLAAEEKRKREKEETDKALKDFQDEMAGHDGGGNEEDPFDGFPPAAVSGSGYGGYGNGAPSAPRRSGPGSLGLMPGQPPNLKRKRALEEAREQEEARREQRELASEYSGTNTGLSRSEDQDRYSAQEEEPEDIAPRPTIQLSSLPPATTADDVKALLRDHLAVHSVHFQQPTGPLSTGRKCLTAIATLSSDTSTSRIDSVVSTLKDKYLGFGFHLSLSRHLSSTAMLPTLSIGPNTTSAEPFGAQKAVKDGPARPSMRNAPPPSQFAPPDSFENTRSAVQPSVNAKVTVQPPAEITTVRAIHTIVERLLTEPDSERALAIEAMLMALPEVQEDERFAFLYDSKSTAGVYYRYLLWNDNDSSEIAGRKSFADRSERIFDDVTIDWTPPGGELPFADLSKLGEALDHRDYESSEEDSDDPESRQFNHSRRDGEIQAQPAGKKRLTPLQLAKFAWFLSRMPPTQAKLRMSEISNVTAFAINNAGAGAEEIVDMLVFNVERPLTNTQCAKYDDEEVSQDEDDVYEPDEELPTIDSAPLPEKKEAEDPSQAKLVALYLINDILHNSSTAGVRNAWKYRQLFENAFRRQRTFEHLGRLEKELGWGRMKSEQWRNRIRALFEIWETGSIFASDVFEALKKDFFEQPSGEEETVDEAAKKQKNVVDMAKFKRIDGTRSSSASASPAVGPIVQPSDIDGDPMVGLEVSSKISDPPRAMEESAKDPDKMDVDNESAAAPVQVEDAPAKPSFSIKSSGMNKLQAPPEPRRRKQAEDMFADSDED